MQEVLTFGSNALLTIAIFCGIVILIFVICHYLFDEKQK